MEDRLKKFAHLVDIGSYTKAADEMHISQPALTAAIKKLERELQITLLERTNPIRLTEAGKLAYDTAKELATATNNLSLKLTEQLHKKPLLRLGMIDSIADTFFSYDVGGFEQLEQQAQTSIVVNNSRVLSQATIRDELDIAFVAEQKGLIHDALVTRRIATEPLIAVCHIDLYEQTVRVVRDGYLPRFISYDQSSSTFHLINEALEKQAIKARPILYSTSPDITLKLVLAQKGIAVLPYLLVKQHLGQGTLQPLLIGSSYVIERPINSVQRRGLLLPESVHTVTNTIRQTLTKLASEAKSLQ